MHECKQCDKLSCRDCIAEWTKQKSTCPNCRAEILPTDKPNRFVRATLDEVVFACAKCPDKFKYAEYSEHAKKCNKTVKCPMPICGAIGDETSLRKHLLESCD